MEEFQKIVQQQMMQRAKKSAEEGVKFLADNGKQEGVVTTASGLQYKVLQKGTGPSPKATDTVRTHYHGTFINGKVFDSSVERGEPAEFSVNGVIPGWTEALQLMKVGDKWQLVIPSKLAYGAGGQPGRNSPGRHVGLRSGVAGNRESRAGRAKWGGDPLREQVRVIDSPSYSQQRGPHGLRCFCCCLTPVRTPPRNRLRHACTVADRRPYRSSPG